MYNADTNNQKLSASFATRRRIAAGLLSAALLCAIWCSAVNTAQAAVEVRADFNGDGFEDLAIGAPRNKINGDEIAGAVHVLYGTAAGLSVVGDQQWYQDRPDIITEFSEPYDDFGAALAAGDFNGDGFSDLAIGAPAEGFVSGGTLVDGAGVVHV